KANRKLTGYTQPTLFHSLQRNADVFPQLLDGLLKFHQAAGLEGDVGPLKVGAKGAAQAVSDAHTLSAEDRQDIGCILPCILPAHILLYAPRGRADTIHGGPEVAQKTIVDFACGEQKFLHGAETPDGIFQGAPNRGLRSGGLPYPRIAKPRAFW